MNSYININAANSYTSPEKLNEMAENDLNLQLLKTSNSYTIDLKSNSWGKTFKSYAYWRGNIEILDKDNKVLKTIRVYNDDKGPQWFTTIIPDNATKVKFSHDSNSGLNIYEIIVE